jgi:D-alanyl-D-alanine dipeptidase
MALRKTAVISDTSKVLILDDLRDHPMPQPDAVKTALDYHQIKINLSGRLNRQQLVDVCDYNVASRSAYARPIAPYYRSFPASLAQVYVRESVAEKLSKVNELLRSYGAELLTLDGFRPIELQLDLWNHFIQKGRETLTDPTDDDLVRFAGMFCSDPRGFDKDDYRTWPVHNTGGAIDLTLRSLDNGQELFMGSIFDDADRVSSTRYFENAALSSQSAIEARRNRRLLYHVMAAVGFANYPHEWWHFDFGTQMWVMNGGHKCTARYGRTELPATEKCIGE